MAVRISIPEEYAVPSELLHLVDGYVQRRERDIDTLKGSIQHGDFATVRILAHNLAGTGEAYGFPQLSRTGKELERAAVNQDSKLAEVQIEILAAAVSTIKRHL